MAYLRSFGRLTILLGAFVTVSTHADSGYSHGKDAIAKASNIQAASHRKQALSLVVVIKCEHYVTALISYDDGTLEHMDLRHVAANEVDRAELTAYQTAMSNLKVVDTGCK